MIWIFTRIAVSLFNTLESMDIPCSVKAYGKNFGNLPLPFSKVTICDLRDSHGL